MKYCPQCSTDKQEGEFYAHPRTRDGLMSSCKECHKARVRARARTNPYVQEYDRMRAKLPHRKALNTMITREWRKKHPDRYRAHNAVKNAIRSGRLEKRDNCEVCGSDFHVHAHHKDYSKPLDVQWLCAKCHHRGHGDEAAAAF